jgi:photosystem II stability/assembly factor-like uncharacterized protein
LAAKKRVQSKKGKNEKVVLMVGTKKGAFILSSNDGRRNWKASGPHFKGTPVFHLNYDKRNGTVFAAVNSYQWGPTIIRSTDLGGTWNRAKNPPKFPKESGLSVTNVWHVEPGTENEPDVVYAGVDPACLFRSTDNGESWTPNSSMLNHETRPKWQAGFGGLCLHTILPDEQDSKKMHIAISAVGTMYTEDAGESWSFQNKNVRADFLPDKYPVYGQCVHKVVRNRLQPKVLYQQNHCGQYRSDDAGKEWKDIQHNLPSDFGFGIAVDYNEPERIYVAPLESGEARVTPGGHFAVWMSDDSGKHWEEQRKGLPNSAYYTVLREGMASDDQDPSGIYVGTETGQVYFTPNQGKSWTKIADNLPPVLSVSASSA